METVVPRFFLGVENGAEIRLDVLGKTLLVFLFDVRKTFYNVLVVFKFGEVVKLRAVRLEAVPDSAFKQGGKSGVGLEQPPSVGDAVCNVLELVGGVGVLVLENVLFDDVGVKL